MISSKFVIPNEGLDMHSIGKTIEGLEDRFFTLAGRLMAADHEEAWRTFQLVQSTKARLDSQYQGEPGHRCIALKQSYDCLDDMLQIILAFLAGVHCVSSEDIGDDYVVDQIRDQLNEKSLEIL